MCFFSCFRIGLIKCPVPDQWKRIGISFELLIPLIEELILFLEFSVNSIFSGAAPSYKIPIKEPPPIVALFSVRVLVRNVFPIVGDRIIRTRTSIHEDSLHVIVVIAVQDIHRGFEHSLIQDLLAVVEVMAVTVIRFIKEALKTVTKAMLWIGRNILGEPVNPDAKITVQADDSYIIDSEAEKAEWREDISLGLRSKTEYRMRFYGETEEAAAAIAKVKAESPSISDLLGE